MMLLEEEWPGRARRRAEGGVAAWRRRGERLCRQVYGAVYPRLIARVHALHPDLAVMMVEQGYGRVLSRSGLDQKTRELVAVTVLAAGGWERQLVSHVMGALRLGAEPGDVRLAVRAGVNGAPAATRAVARQALKLGLANDRRSG
jgi:AhpD family alkylhydroperoxidase